MQTPGNVIGVIGVSDCSRYGTVEFSNEGFVTKFAEKVSDVRKGWINAGVYKLKRNVFTQRKVEKFSLEEVVFPDLVSRRELTVVPLKGEFCDIGIPSNYYALQSKLLKHRE
jgi:NDP-sugar pyrophosphorylase family protein